MFGLFKKKRRRPSAPSPRLPERVRSQTGRRNYAMAKMGGLTNDWFSGDATADQMIYQGLRRMRNRARDLARNDDYTRRFIGLARNNIIGPYGITFRARSRDYINGVPVPDAVANGKIETAFNAWMKPGTCTCDRIGSLTDVEAQLVQGLITDGEFICRKVRGVQNGYGFALQPIDPERLDEQLNRAARPASAGVSAQNEIRMGVELDSFGGPVAYHFIDGDSSVNSYGQQQRRGYQRLPAAEIVHVFIQERPGQTRGVTMLAPVALRKKMLDGFMGAVTDGARAAACKMGWFVRDPENPGDAKSEDNSAFYEASPGQIEEMPVGFNDFKPFDPGYPPANFEEFTKTILRGISAGLGVSYLALSNDMQGVSYSGGRLAMLADQDVWRCLQVYVIEHFCERIYPDWLLMALTTQVVALPLAKLDKWAVSRWRPRGWKWADPQREVQAYIQAIKAGLTSFTAVCNETGTDFEEVIEELAENYALAKASGVTLLLDILPPAPVQTVEEEEAGKGVADKSVCPTLQANPETDAE